MPPNCSMGWTDEAYSIDLPYPKLWLVVYRLIYNQLSSCLSSQSLSC